MQHDMLMRGLASHTQQDYIRHPAQAPINTLLNILPQAR